MHTLLLLSRFEPDQPPANYSPSYAAASAATNHDVHCTSRPMAYSQLKPASPLPNDQQTEGHSSNSNQLIQIIIIFFKNTIAQTSDDSLIKLQFFGDIGRTLPKLGHSVEPVNIVFAYARSSALFRNAFTESGYVEPTITLGSMKHCL